MTIRDNSARFQAPVVDVPQSEENTSVSNELHYVIPTEFVDLPTKGLFYPEGHPLHKKEEIEIRLMTAKEEDLLVNKSLLKKGVALDRMLQSLIVNPRIKLDDLYIGDKNAIIVTARVSAYGADYGVSVTCPNCTSVQKYQFNLEDNNLNYADQEKEDAILTENGTYIITLPKTKAKVEVRLLVSRDEKKFFGTKKKRDDFTITDQFKAYIIAINDVSDQNLVSQFIDVMPAFDSKYLRQTYSKIVPNVDLTQHYECSNCEYEQDMEVPFTVEFFWPRS